MIEQHARAEALDRAIDAARVGERPDADAAAQADRATADTLAALHALAEATSPSSEYVSALESRLLATAPEQVSLAPLGAAATVAPPAAAMGAPGPGGLRHAAPVSRRARNWLLTGARRLASLAAVALLCLAAAGALALVLPGVLRRGIAPSPSSVAAPSPVPVPPALATAVLLETWDAASGRAAIIPADPLTGQPLPDYAPVMTRENGTLRAPQAVSANGQKLAVVAAQGQACEAYAGGTSCRASADNLRLVDVPTWRETTAPLPTSGWAWPLAFDPAAARLALAYNTSTSTTLLLFNATTGQLAAQRQLPFRPALLDYTRDGASLILYGQPLGSDPGMAKPAPPRALLLDAATLDTRWDYQLADLVSGEWCETACFSWSPGVILAPDRRALYLVHADAERLTTVDLAARTVHTVAIGAAQPRPDRLLALTARSAAAKGDATGAFKTAVISPDGKQLYVVGLKRQAASSTPAPRPATAETFGLLVLDAASGRTLAHHDIPAVGIALTPDGAHLLLTDSGLTWTEILDARTRTPVTRLDGWTVQIGRRLDGQPLLLASRSPGQTSELAVLDPCTFAVIASWPAGAVSWVTGP